MAHHINHVVNFFEIFDSDDEEIIPLPPVQPLLWDGDNNGNCII